MINILIPGVLGVDIWHPINTSSSESCGLKFQVALFVYCGCDLYGQQIDLKQPQIYVLHPWPRKN